MRNKHTKIVATVSDLHCDANFIKELYDNGVDVIRLNTAHQDEEQSLRIVNNVRKVSDNVAILVDIKGPEIRVSKLDKPILFEKGDKVKIQTNIEINSNREIIQVSYPNFVKEVPVGSKILIDDGNLELKVNKKDEKSLYCTFINRGELSSRKSVNVPDVIIQIPSLSKKDIRYINFSIENKVDFIAHSFVRNKKDVLAVQNILDKEKSDIKIIAKIENREGVNNIDEIIDTAYGIMIARGDLGVEIPIEEVPSIQKEIIRKCIQNAKPVIVATQMLQSMTKNPRCTRAEANDVANSVYDCSDALMLSGETAYGDYPIESVKMMTKIIKNIESIRPDHDITMKKEGIISFLARSTLMATREIKDVKAIVVPTSKGFTARLVSSLRSKKYVYAECKNKTVMRQLNLSYGVKPDCITEIKKNPAEAVYISLKKLVKDNILDVNDVVIVLASSPNSKIGFTNSVVIDSVEKCLQVYN